MYCVVNISINALNQFLPFKKKKKHTNFQIYFSSMKYNKFISNTQLLENK